MKKRKNMAAFFLALALAVNMLFAGNIVIEAETNDTEDVTLPVITSIKKVTNEKIYTGTEIPYEVSYSSGSESENVESISLWFECEGEVYYGELYDKAQENNYYEATLGKDGENKTLYLSLDSSARTAIGTFTLKSIMICAEDDSFSEYSEDDFEEENLEASIEEESSEDETTVSEPSWEQWVEACSFTREICEEGLTITGVSLDVANRDAVAPGTKFNAHVQVKNNRNTDYIVGYSDIFWSGPISEDNYETYAWGSWDNEYPNEEGIILPEKSGEIVIPVQLDKDAIEGKQTLNSINISECIMYSDESEGSEAENTDVYIIFENGTLYSFYGGNLAGIKDVNADFTIKKPSTPSAVTPSKPAPTTPAVTSTPTTNTQPAAPAEVINRKLKGTKIISLKAAKKKVVVKWKKQTKKTKGYQLQYSTDKKFKTGVKTKTINGNKKTSVTLKGLKSKKTYYVRIRTWQKTSTGKAYSTWSKAKKVKVK